MFPVLGVLLFTGYPVAFVLGGVGLAFGLAGIGVGAFQFVQFGSLPSRIFGGIMENAILTAIPMFILMGTMLDRAGIARDLLNCLQVLLRRVPGGLALAVTVMGTILAATTGVVGASITTMSLLALPVMIERKYDHELATGTVAASGTLGVLIPPSIMLVMMADMLSRSVGKLFVAAVLPGLILAGLYISYIVIRCAMTPGLAPQIDDDDDPKTVRETVSLVIRSLVPTGGLVFLVLGSILGGFATATEAAGCGAMGALFLGLARAVFPVESHARKPGQRQPGEAEDPGYTAFDQNVWGRLRLFRSTVAEVVERTMLINAMIFAIFIGATLFSYVFRILGGGELIVTLVHSLGFGSWGLLLLIMAIVFVLGFFLDWLEIVLIVVPVFAPIIGLLDFGEHVARSELIYWFAILLAINLQTSFLTPPFGISLFYLKSVAPPAIRSASIYRGILPFVLLQLVGLGLVLAFPDIALWLPRMVLD